MVRTRRLTLLRHQAAARDSFDNPPHPVVDSRVKRACVAEGAACGCLKGVCAAQPANQTTLNDRATWSKTGRPAGRPSSRHAQAETLLSLRLTSFYGRFRVLVPPGGRSC